MVQQYVNCPWIAISRDAPDSLVVDIRRGGVGSKRKSPRIPTSTNTPPADGARETPGCPSTRSKRAGEVLGFDLKRPENKEELSEWEGENEIPLFLNSKSS